VKLLKKKYQLTGNYHSAFIALTIAIFQNKKMIENESSLQPCVKFENVVCFCFLINIFKCQFFANPFLTSSYIL
jgi:hypothetical protein